MFCAVRYREEKASSHLVLALEHLCGGMLLDRLKKDPLSEHHAAAACHQIVTCILYMHHTGYLHRDLKPDNVMLTYDWDPETDKHLPPPVKLIDLGMVLNYVKQPNETGLMGSPGYMSPEAIRCGTHNSLHACIGLLTTYVHMYRVEPCIKIMFKSASIVKCWG